MYVDTPRTITAFVTGVVDRFDENGDRVIGTEGPVDERRRFGAPRREDPPHSLPVYGNALLQPEPGRDHLTIDLLAARVAPLDVDGDGTLAGAELVAAAQRFGDRLEYVHRPWMGPR